jgi:murein L,D-transpeptidase YcbB/YkuD
LGDLTPVNLSQSEVYDEGLWQDIIQFQTRHGLENEGEIGKKTLTALNITPANHLNKVKANLERWRWLPQAFGNYYIKVNIANFKLTVVKNNQIIATHKVIAGKPARMTPVFSATLQYLVFNPT